MMMIFYLSSMSLLVLRRYGTFSDLFSALRHDAHLQNEVLEQKFIEVAMERSIQQEIKQSNTFEAKANE